MKIKKLLLVCSLLLSGGAMIASATQTNTVRVAEAATTTVTETLTNSHTTGTTYISKAFNGSAGTSYQGNFAGSNGSFQIRSTNNNSGIVVTKSIGKVKSIKITWDSNTSTSRKLNVYGSNTAYTDPTDLFKSGLSYLKQLTYSASGATYTFTGDYAYFGIRSASGAQYVDQIDVTWEVESGDESGPTEYTVNYDATPSSFVNTADSSTTLTLEEGETEGTVTLPTADKLANNGSFYAGTAHVTGWKGANGTTYELGATAPVSANTLFTATHEQLKSEITAAEAAIIAKEAGTTATLYSYTVSGTVTAITNAYNDSYKSIGVTIEDENGDTINAYGMKSANDYDISRLVVGAEVTVTGNLINYNNTTPQFNTNCTAVVHVEDINAPTNVEYDAETYDLTWDAVEGAAKYALVITSSEGEEVVNEELTETSYNVASLLDDEYSVSVTALGDPLHNDSEAATYSFKKEAPASETVQYVETHASLGFGYNKTVTGDAEVATYTAAYTASATANFKADGSNEAATLGLTTDSGIALIAHKGKASNAPGLNKDNDFRLYYNAEGSNYFEFNSKSKVQSIKITFTGATYNKALVSTDNKTAIEGTGTDTVKEYTINNNTFFIGHGGTTGQVRMKSIVINVGSQETTWEFGNVRMRFQATVDADLYTRLNAEAAGFEVTAEGSTKVETIDCTANVGTNEEGNRYIIGSITQIPETAYNTVLTAKAFFTVAGERVYLQEVSYSVATLVEEYLTTYYASLDAEAQEAIKAFSETL